MDFIAIYQIECLICGTTPVVGLKTPGGHVASTGLCGSHFWGDRSMADPDEWNRQIDSTE